ncbi:MAG: phosphoribosylformylglycinamidine synthase I [Planctomycetes bacterium]|nr:phosphoribosylformylglycinamidine synthase I [Planctomycetota bacterium]
MATPKALVLRTAGTNCDGETLHALTKAGFQAERTHVLRVIESPATLENCAFLVVPGGFSYGDDVSAGKILANQMLHHLGDALRRFIAADKLILGICNGFQVLIKAGLLPEPTVDPATAAHEATLAWNDCGQFVDRWIHLRADSDVCVLVNRGDVISLPIAHGEGRFVCRDEAVLKRLQKADQVALRYCDAEGVTGTPGANPNGSDDDIAGLCDPTGRILGLMPHPERFVDIVQHPTWTRGTVKTADGLGLFRKAYKALA